MSRELLPTPGDDSMTVRMVEILRRRKLLAAATFAAVLAGAAAFAMYLPDLYRGSALVLIERPVSESVMRTPVAGELESRLHVIKQEILSRDRLRNLITRFDLYPELRQKTGWEDVLNHARDDFQVEPIGAEQVSGRVKTVAFRLTYTGDARDKVADVTNAVAAFYVSQNNEMRTREAVNTKELLARELADAKRELERQEKALRDFTASNASELPQQAMITLASLERVNNQLSINGSRQLRVLEARDKLFEERATTSVAARAAAADPDASPESIARVRAIEELKIKLTELETRFAAQHPDVRAMRDQVASLEQAHAAAEEVEAKKRAEAAVAAARANAAAAAPIQGRRTVADYDKELAELKAEEAQLKAQANVLQARLETTPGTQQGYTLVTRDYSSAKDHYDSLMRRYEDAELTADVETSQAGERFRILEAAIPPEGPAAPNRFRLLIMGVLLAFAAAAGAVMVREQFDTSFHSVDEIREFTAVPVLVSIPPIGPTTNGRRMRTAFAAASAVAAIVLVAGVAAYMARGNDQLVRLIAF